MTDQKIFPCDDLHAASFIATRCRLMATTQNGQRTIFHFSDTDGRATAASLDFINGPTVNLREFLAAFRELKSVSYAARRTGAKNE